MANDLPKEYTLKNDVPKEYTLKWPRVRTWGHFKVYFFGTLELIHFSLHHFHISKQSSFGITIICLITIFKKSPTHYEQSLSAETLLISLLGGMNSPLFLVTNTFFYALFSHFNTISEIIFQDHSKLPNYVLLNLNHDLESLHAQFEQSLLKDTLLMNLLVNMTAKFS